MFNSRISRERESELSSLAQGRGFYQHGVEVECFIDDFKAYSLNGQSFVKSSVSGSGRSSKQYKNHTLTLPKTYLTKRGQMVLFTAPEDMIMGQSCAIHQKDVLSKKVLQKLKTTHDLARSAVTYDKSDAPTDENSGLPEFEERPGVMDGWPGRKGAWKDEREVKAGHFTDVYLRCLQKATANAHCKAGDDFTVEDLESKDLTLDSTGSRKTIGEDLQMDVETPDCDSGLGQFIGPSSSSNRLFAHSQRSESSAVISIPHGSMLEEKEAWSPMAELEVEVTQEVDDGGLEALKQELALYKVKAAADSKKLAKTGKKRQHPKSQSSRSGEAMTPNLASTSKLKSKKSSKVVNSKVSGIENQSSSKLDQLRSGHAKPSKVKKRRGKKQVQARDEEVGDSMAVEGGMESDSRTALGTEMHTAVQDHVTEEQGHVRGVRSHVTEGQDHVTEGMGRVTGKGRGLVGEGPLEITAVQLTLGEGGASPPPPSRSRRPSRAEERRLEINRKRLEKRETERLKKLAEEEEQRLKEEAEFRAAQDLGATESEAEDEIVPASPEPHPPSPPPLGVNQQQLLDALERAKLRENRLLLALKIESSDRMLTDEIKSVEEAVERARRAAEELERKQEEEERRRREEEELQRAEEERKRLEEEAIQNALTRRAKSIQKKTARLRSDTEKAVETEKSTKRYQDNVTPSIMFSYFSYVPPPNSRKKTDFRNPKRGQRTQTIRSK